VTKNVYRKQTEGGNNLMRRQARYFSAITISNSRDQEIQAVRGAK
jgi:hypothetical protein